jgi:hypothetical protein
LNFVDLLDARLFHVVAELFYEKSLKARKHGSSLTVWNVLGLPEDFIEPLKLLTPHYELTLDSSFPNEEVLHLFFSRRSLSSCSKSSFFAVCFVSQVPDDLNFRSFNVHIQPSESPLFPISHLLVKMFIGPLESQLSTYSPDHPIVTKPFLDWKKFFDDRGWYW